MKKYEVLSKIGGVLSGSGIIAFLFIMSTDIDHSGNNVFVKMLIGILVSTAMIGLGEMLINFMYVEGLLLGIYVTVGAFLYKRRRKPSKSLKRCYTIYRKFGTYRDTFTQCRKLYNDYVYSLYYDELNYLEVKDEQLK